MRGALVAVSLSLSSPALAGSGGQLFGSRPVDKPQLTLELGFPDVQVGVQVPVRKDLDLRPRARLSWARGTVVGPLEASLGVDLRLLLLDQGRLSAGLIASLPLHFAVLPDGGVAPGIGLLWPGLSMTWSVEGLFQVDLGVQLQDDLYVMPGGRVVFDARVPLLAAVEYELATGVTLGLMIEGGPRFAGVINAPVPPGNVAPYVRVALGLGYTF